MGLIVNSDSFKWHTESRSSALACELNIQIRYCFNHILYKQTFCVHTRQPGAFNSLKKKLVHIPSIFLLCTRCLTSISLCLISMKLLNSLYLQWNVKSFTKLNKCTYGHCIFKNDNRHWLVIFRDLLKCSLQTALIPLSIISVPFDGFPSLVCPWTNAILSILLLACQIGNVRSECLPWVD